MSEMLTPDLEKEILNIQSQIRRTEFNIRRIAEGRVHQAEIRIADYPKKPKNDYFYVWTLGMGFILGVWMTILVRAL